MSAFADDLKLQIIERKLEDGMESTEEEEAIGIFEESCSIFEQPLNKNKSKVMRISGRLSNPRQKTYNDIELCQEYKYLGI